MVPSCTPDKTATTTRSYHLEPPKLLMASTNLTLAYLLQCRESISYLPLPWPHIPSDPSLAPLSSTSHLGAYSPHSPSTPPHPLSHEAFPPHTLFSQSALIFSTGIFASEAYPPIGISKASPILPLHYPRAATAPQRAAGRKVERWSTDRFESNAETGRGAMMDAAQRAWESMK